MHPIFCPIYIRCSYYTAWHQSQYHLIFWCGVRNCGLGRAILYFYCFFFFFFAQNWFITKIFFFFFTNDQKCTIYLFLYYLFWFSGVCLERGAEHFFFFCQKLFSLIKIFIFYMPTSFFCFSQNQGTFIIFEFQTTITEAWAILTLYRLQTSTLFFLSMTKDHLFPQRLSQIIFYSITRIVIIIKCQGFKQLSVPKLH